MKNLQVFISTLIAMFLCCILSAQCPEGEINLTSQQQIDDFSINYPNCTEVENITIRGYGSINNLNGLSQITVVDGNMIIEFNYELTNLNGLSNVQTVSGDLDIGGLDRYCHSQNEICETVYRGNRELTDLAGLESLTSIGGTLFIIGNENLSSLTGLDNLETIGGLNVHANDALTNFTGLDRLKTISGDFELFDIYGDAEDVLPNPSNYYDNETVSRALGSNTLISFAGLDSLTTIEGSLRIVDNNALTNLSGLETLTSVGGNLVIGQIDFNSYDFPGGDQFYHELSGNDALINLLGLENLAFVGGKLQIIGNPNIVNCVGLQNLQTIGELQVCENSVLTDLSGLEALTHIEGNLDLYYARIVDIFWGHEDRGDNDAMTSLTGLENLTAVNGKLRIARHDMLSDLSAIANLDHTGITELMLKQNPNLSGCGLPVICNYLASGGTANISDNNSGCYDIASIQVTCNCPSNDVMLLTQEEVDSFAAQYPNCTELENLSINGSDISNLEALSQITAIFGNLIIKETNIETLSGLENLTAIQGNLYIGDFNPSSCCILDNFNNSTYKGNHNLNSLSGLENLETLNGDLLIVDNTLLTSLSPLSGLNTIGGSLYLYKNNALTSLDGLSNLQAVNGDIAIGRIEMYCGSSNCQTQYFGQNNLTDISGLEGISTVNGTLSIVGNTNLSSLTGLNNMETVGGLTVYANNALTDFTGLENLQTIEGDFTLAGLRTYIVEIEQNPYYVEGSLSSNALLSFQGLDNLTTIEGNMTVVEHNALTNFSGLETLTEIGGNLIVGRVDEDIYYYGNYAIEPAGNEQLISFSGLNNLASIGGKLQIAANDNLPNCMGLDNLQTTGGLQVFENESLENLTGLEALTHIDGDLEIYYERGYGEAGNNYAMESLTGLENLSSINGRIRIVDNNILNDLTAIDNLDHTSIQSIWIIDNQNLSACNTNLICNYLDAGGNSTVSGNAPGCIDIGEIQASCLGQDLPCPTSDFVFKTQQELNYFVVQYSHCTEFMGNVTIGHPDDGGSTTYSSIDDLTPLGNITTIHGNLTINHNNVLSDLNGLSSLQTIGGDLIIYENPELANLNGLDDLLTIGGGLQLGRRDVHKIYGSLYCGSTHNMFIHYEGNDVLTDISTLSNIDSLEYLMIIGNPGLTNLSGLDNLTTIDDDFLFIKNYNISNFSGLENLTHIGGNLTVGRIQLETVFGPVAPDLYKHYREGNNNLTSLSGLNSLAFVGGNFTIGDNDAMANIDALQQLQSIGGSFNFYENNQIANLSGLSALTTIGGDLEFAYRYYYEFYYNLYDTETGNHALTDLTGLENLNSINGEIFITKNTALTNLNALNNLDHTSIINLTLTFNDNLSVCNTTSICNYLESNGESEIFNNAAGCSSVEGIENTCIVSTSTPDDLPQVTISPNPSTGMFQVKGIPQGTYQIHDTQGRIVQSGNIQNNLSINISQETQGVYFISIQIENEIITKRIVKM